MLFREMEKPELIDSIKLPLNWKTLGYKTKQGANKVQEKVDKIAKSNGFCGLLKVVGSLMIVSALGVTILSLSKLKRYVPVSIAAFLTPSKGVGLAYFGLFGIIQSYKNRDKEVPRKLKQASTVMGGGALLLGALSPLKLGLNATELLTSIMYGGQFLWLGKASKVKSKRSASAKSFGKVEMGIGGALFLAASVYLIASRFGVAHLNISSLSAAMMGGYGLLTLATGNSRRKERGEKSVESSTLYGLAGLGMCLVGVAGLAFMGYQIRIPAAPLPGAIMGPSLFGIASLGLASLWNIGVGFDLKEQGDKTVALP